MSEPSSPSTNFLRKVEKFVDWADGVDADLRVGNPNYRGLSTWPADKVERRKRRLQTLREILSEEGFSPDRLPEFLARELESRNGHIKDH